MTRVNPMDGAKAVIVFMAAKIILIARHVNATIGVPAPATRILATRPERRNEPATRKAAIQVPMNANTLLERNLRHAPAVIPMGPVATARTIPVGETATVFRICAMNPVHSRVQKLLTPARAEVANQVRRRNPRYATVIQTVHPVTPRIIQAGERATTLTCATNPPSRRVRRRRMPVPAEVVSPVHRLNRKHAVVIQTEPVATTLITSVGVYVPDFPQSVTSRGKRHVL